MNEPLDWRSALNEWIQSNPRKMSSDLETLRQKFLRRFPRENLTRLTLEEYTLGHDGSKDSFCYWLEWETGMMGSVRGGSSAKWGVWWSKERGDWSYNERSFDGPQDALNKLMAGLTNLLNAAGEGNYDQLDEIGDTQLGRNRNSLRSKPLYMYFPNKFLPISNPSWLVNILRYFGLKPIDGVHARNRQLLEYLHDLPEFDGFETQQMGRFIWTYKLYEKAATFRNQVALQKAIDAFVRFASSSLYGPNEYDYKANMLQALTAVLSDVREQDADSSIAALREFVTAYRQSGINLTSWQEWDILNKYLASVPADNVQQNVISLLDDDGDLIERIDTFREKFEVDYKQYLQSKGTIRLGIISLFLMGYLKGDHIIYRASIVKKACSDWDGPDIIGGHRNDGSKYSQYLTIIPSLRSILTKALDRPVDMIDVHSLLWFNFTDSYDQYKEESGLTMVAVDERPFMRHLVRVANRTRNIILYGPPGTGKTYWAREFSQRFGNRVEFITFHQSFAYEDFVEGLKPSSDNSGRIRYDVQDGAFKRICQRAKEESDKEYLLVIDEINRANIAKVFGELITLIEDDKRLGMEYELQAILPYSGKSFSVPQNLYLMGTMNTADRSIALLDMALRRRFTYIEVMPHTSLLPEIDDLSLGTLLERLNERIIVLLDRDHQIGHSYFLNVESLADLRFVWEHRVVPLLQEYFYNDSERLKSVIGDSFVEAIKVSQETQDALASSFDPDMPQFQLLELSDEAFLSALKMLSGSS